jgi:hypothetical protein
VNTPGEIGKDGNQGDYKLYQQVNVSPPEGKNEELVHAK